MFGTWKRNEKVALCSSLGLGTLHHCCSGFSFSFFTICFLTACLLYRFDFMALCKFFQTYYTMLIWLSCTHLSPVHAFFIASPVDEFCRGCESCIIAEILVYCHLLHQLPIHWHQRFLTDYPCEWSNELPKNCCTHIYLGWQWEVASHFFASIIIKSQSFEYAARV